MLHKLIALFLFASSTITTCYSLAQGTVPGTNETNPADVQANLAASPAANPSAKISTNALANIGPGGRPVGQAWSRSPVYAANGMAATAQPLASQIAINILQAGGSAVDAAIAANAALGLMEPTGNGIGGDLFAIVWDPKSQRLHGLNASGRSPASRSLAQLRDQLQGADSIPPLGHLPVTVPGGRRIVCHAYLRRPRHAARVHEGRVLCQRV